MLRQVPTAVALLLAGLVAPAHAQEIDPALDTEALAVLEDGRLLVRNGPAILDCALTASGGSIALGACRAPEGAAGDAAEILAALGDDDWQALVRGALQDAGCTLSSFGAVAEVIAAAAEANGVAPETIARVRADLSVRAEAAVDAMLRDGRLSFRNGELALDNCP